jgi:hypothetical protein
MKSIQMNNETPPGVEMRDVADGLWIWRFVNPFWKAGFDWEPLTTSTCVHSGSETLILDPQAPPLFGGVGLTPLARSLQA